MKKAYPLLLSVLSGCIFSLAWPTAGFPLLLFFAFLPLFYIEELVKSSRNAGFQVWGYSYIAFLTWNLITTWWVYNSTAEGGLLAFSCNSLFMSWVYYLAFITKRKFGDRLGNFALIIFWVAFEYMHMNWKLSWPWLTLGNGFARFPEWVQWYEFTGVLGGSIWVIAMNIFLYRLIRNFSIKKTVAPALLTILPIALSYVIYISYTEESNPVRIAVIQPNIDPYNEKFANGSQAAQFSKLLRLAQTLATPETDYFVFPETALPDGLWNFEIDTYPQFLSLRQFLSATPKAKIIIGGTYYEMFTGIPRENLPFSVSRLGKNGDYYDDYNAAFQIDTSRMISVYKKSKLVPGPESYPLPEWTKPFQESMFKEIGGMMGNLGSQKERSAFFAPDKPELGVGPIICYESIYGEFVTEYVQKGASLLFIITNDGWWGNSPGHRQHFQYARLRAVETRRSIARSANTGISGFINQRGDVIQQTPYWEEAAISETLNANNKLTFYVKYGDYLGRGAVILGSIIFLYLVIVLGGGFIKRKKA